MTQWSNVEYAVATASGRGAIASVIVVGQNCVALISQLFRPMQRDYRLHQQMQRPIYGHWLVDGKPREDLIVCAISKNHVEIHCHGGTTSTKIIGRSLANHGAREISQLKMAEAVLGNRYLADFELQLANAKTWRTSQIMLWQRNSQQQFFCDLRGAITNHDLPACKNLMNCSFRWKKFGSKLTSNWNVVLCGRPNVGKSSLINRLVGFERSLVHGQAGTTRDVVHQITAIDGWPIQFTDTAGIRTTSNVVEKTGIELAENQISNSDLTILVVDASADSNEEIHVQVKRWRPGIVVANKRDLAGLHELDVDLFVSARTDGGIDELITLIVSRLVPEYPDPSDTVWFSDYQSNFVGNLRAQIESESWAESLRLLDEFFQDPAARK